MTLTDHLQASRIIAARLPYTPPAHDLPRNKQDVRLLAANDRAVAARETVRVLERRVADQGDDIEGRRT